MNLAGPSQEQNGESNIGDTKGQLLSGSFVSLDATGSVADDREDRDDDDANDPGALFKDAIDERDERNQLSIQSRLKADSLVCKIMTLVTRKVKDTCIFTGLMGQSERRKGEPVARRPLHTAL